MSRRFEHEGRIWIAEYAGPKSRLPTGSSGMRRWRVRIINPDTGEAMLTTVNPGLGGLERMSDERLRDVLERARRRADWIDEGSGEATTS